MENGIKLKNKTKEGSQKANQQKTGYISWWLFRTKGTVAETLAYSRRVKKG